MIKESGNDLLLQRLEKITIFKNFFKSDRVFKTVNKN